MVMRLIDHTDGTISFAGQDIGAAAVYLASRAGDYTIGETLTVDGGIVNAHLPTHFADPAVASDTVTAVHMPDGIEWSAMSKELRGIVP